jgi:hypothetical protein
MDRFMKFIGLGVILAGLTLAVLLASGASSSSPAAPPASAQDCTSINALSVTGRMAPATPPRARS